jgi:thioredoxin reductase (NADPH)
MARAYTQAEKFGVEMAIPDDVASLQQPGDGAGFVLQLANGERVNTRTVVIASGARYRRLDLDTVAHFEGSAVHFWASPLEARICERQEVAIVGGGNSAGQAAVYLAGHAAKVWLLCRGHSLEASMSRYLIDRIAALSNVEIVLQTEVTALDGRDGVLDAVRWRTRSVDNETRRPVHHLFLFIGAEPNTGWLAGCGVALDGKGFVRTNDLAVAGLPLGTSVPGVFAIGDVRSGSVKRVAAAVGEGAQVVASLHAYLADSPQRASLPIHGPGARVADRLNA